MKLHQMENIQEEIIEQDYIAGEFHQAVKDIMWNFQGMYKDTCKELCIYSVSRR